MSENYQIRPAKKDDCAEIKRLIQELADFEKHPDGPKLSVEDLQRDGFESDPPKYRCIVVENNTIGADGSLCGYAIYFQTYSTWEGSALRLEDIYVSPAHRRNGLGRILLAHIAKEAEDEGFCRIDFSVLSWNPASAFYKLLGAHNITDLEQWAMWRFEKDTIHELAERARN
ncbi:thialysine N-epsilon-acetyltransferase [Neocloeon triangulifer]|uniref:thialysine N-epsilon-acetyltransferase n=1 Tax=Neocloeon triangulifer TaxID=2078957 RepID=UPI00286EEB23|nr:thialysine N-epsilon-acetyltransferase [Neocloeon triangulifer]